jgi:hypothetical protein
MNHRVEAPGLRRVSLPAIRGKDLWGTTRADTFTDPVSSVCTQPRGEFYWY